MTGITVQSYREELAGAWDTFVEQWSRNGTIFHERKFLGYHAQGRFTDASLLFYEEKQLVGVLPAAKVKGAEDERIVSHPGSSAGGLVFHRRHGVRQVFEMLDLAIGHYAEESVSQLEMRLAEPIFSSPSDAELSFCLWQRGFTMATREISSCVNLRQGEWPELGRSRNAGYIRKLKPKARVVRLESPQLIYPLIEQTLDERYQKRPTHTVDELAELKRRYPKRLDLWCVLVDEVPVATVVVFLATRHTVHDFYIAQDHALSQLQAMPLLFDTVFRHYRDAGFEWFNFGISSRGESIKWGILEFKERMGGRGICRDGWVIDLRKDAGGQAAEAA